MILYEVKTQLYSHKKTYYLLFKNNFDLMASLSQLDKRIEICSFKKLYEINKLTDLSCLNNYYDANEDVY
jgi:hypothetical protein